MRDLQITARRKMKVSSMKMNQLELVDVLDDVV
jgi:hypothetical protein